MQKEVWKMQFDIKEIENAKVTYPDMAQHIRGGI